MATVSAEDPTQAEPATALAPAWHSVGATSLVLLVRAQWAATPYLDFTMASRTVTHAFVTPMPAPTRTAHRAHLRHRLNRRNSTTPIRLLSAMTSSPTLDSLILAKHPTDRTDSIPTIAKPASR